MTVINRRKKSLKNLIQKKNFHSIFNVSFNICKKKKSIETI